MNRMDAQTALEKQSEYVNRLQILMQPAEMSLLPIKCYVGVPLRLCSLEQQ